MEDLDGHVAVVTGATSGIGAAIARRLVAAGGSVVLCGRRADAGRAVARELGAAASFVQADMGNDQDVRQLIEEAVAAHGRLDCLVNNAGLPGQACGLLDLDMDRFDAVLAVNLRAPLIAIRAAVPAMIKQGSGSIVNIASVSGYRAGYSGHDYSVAKAGLLHLTRSLAVELARHEIRVNAISPGPIATGIFDKAAGHTDGLADDPDGRDPADSPIAQFLPDNQPLSRVGVADDVARAAAFLASAAASFITGQNLSVDGGLSIGRPWSVLERERNTIAAQAADQARGRDRHGLSRG